MTNVIQPAILELSGTTYFDNLQDHGTESGKPSGELKIREVPELPEKGMTKVMKNEG